MQEVHNLPKILVVDDEPANLNLLNELLKNTYKVYLSPSGKHALNFLDKIKPDIILLDVVMPEMNGYEIIKILKSDDNTKDIPVIYLTGLDNQNNESLAFQLGAVDYLSKPIVAESVLNRLKIHIDLQRYQHHLEDIIEERTAQLVKTQEVILNVMANLTEVKDQDTGEHVMRTTEYMRLLIESLQKLNHPDYYISSEDAKNIIATVKLHDIGKVAIPDEILSKPGKLTDEEFEVVKTHVLVGAKVIEDAINDYGEKSPFFIQAREIILSHHEKWDGTGYPYGLSKTDIPLSGRLMAIADVYDALVSERPYKKAFPHEEATKIIFEGYGTHFDPYLIENLQDTIDDFKEVKEKIADKVSRKHY